MTTPKDQEELRELDRFCAVEVLGYKWTDNPDDWTADKVNQCWLHPQGIVVSSPWQSRHQPEPFQNHWQHQWRAFRPTVESADAMLVLEKCLDHAGQWHLAVELMKWKDGKFSLYSTDKIQASAMTMTETIARFAKSLFTQTADKLEGK